MSLELSQLYDLYSSRVDPLQVGELPEPVADYISAKLPYVYFSTYTLRHIMEKHSDVDYFDMLCIPMLLKDSLWVGQENKKNKQGQYVAACASFVHPGNRNRYIAAVKMAANGYEVYLSTFHRGRKRQTRSLLKRGPILQTHK